MVGYIRQTVAASFLCASAGLRRRKNLLGLTRGIYHNSHKVQNKASQKAACQNVQLLVRRLQKLHGRDDDDVLEDTFIRSLPLPSDRESCALIPAADTQLRATLEQKGVMADSLRGALRNYH